VRKYVDGNGADSTAAVVAHLLSTPTPIIFTLVKISLSKWLDNVAGWVGGGTVNPSPFTKTFLLTDCPAAIIYTPLGTFRTADVKHGAIPFSVGTDFKNFEVTWVPTASDVVSYGDPAVTGGGWFATAPNVAAFEAAWRGFFDGAFISVYKVVMPSFYDANTFGACLLHTGAVDDVTVEGGEIRFNVGSLLDQQEQQVPSQLIGPNSRFSSVDPLAYANVNTGSFVTQDGVRWTGWLADRPQGYFQSASFLQGPCSSSAFFVPATGFFDGGFVVWQFGPLTGMRRPIAQYTRLGTSFGSFQLAQPFPYDATLYDSGFAFGFGFDAYARRRVVTTESAGTYNGFPHVPMPENAL